MEPADDTAELLRRWHGADKGALATLLERDMPWLRREVSKRLGARLRDFGDTDDYVGDVTLKALEWTPRFVVSSRAAFRRLLLRVAQNTLRDAADRAAAQMRSLRREIPLREEAALVLDLAQTPRSALAEAEERGLWRSWLLLGIDLLDPEEAWVVLLRVWRGADYGAIAEELGVTPDAARMRFNRVVAKLTTLIDRLRRGELTEVLDDLERGDTRVS